MVELAATFLGTAVAALMAYLEIRRQRNAKFRDHARKVTTWIDDRPRAWPDGYTASSNNVTEAVVVYNASGFPIRGVHLEIWFADQRRSVAVYPANPPGYPWRESIVAPHDSNAAADAFPVDLDEVQIDPDEDPFAFSVDEDPDEVHPYRYIVMLGFTDHRGKHWILRDGHLRRTRIPAGGNPKASELFRPTKRERLADVAKNCLRRLDLTEHFEPEVMRSLSTRTVSAARIKCPTVYLAPQHRRDPKRQQ